MSKNIILADTKFEFGVILPLNSLEDPHTVTIYLADEVLAPDSSRYWDLETFASIHPTIHNIPASNHYSSSNKATQPRRTLDKQLLRNWLAREGLAGLKDKQLLVKSWRRREAITLNVGSE